MLRGKLSEDTRYLNSAARKSGKLKVGDIDIKNKKKIGEVLRAKHLDDRVPIEIAI